MDFHQLLAKMQELDQPQVEAAPVVEQPITECPPEGPMGMDHSTPETSPPSMSVNLNAQGLDNISDILKLIAKVNPDTEAPADASLPSMGGMPSLTPPGPKIGGLGNLDAGPLKMLPDLDAEEPGEAEPVEIDPIDRDGQEDGEEDNDDAKETRYAPHEYGGEHDPDPEPKRREPNPFPFGDDDKESDEAPEDESFGNSVGGSEPKFGGVKDVVRDGNDLNKPKKSFSDKPYRGDNPMAAESTDLRSQIRAELLRRLEEAKGVK
jgi:hypothetical protein